MNPLFRTQTFVLFMVVATHASVLGWVTQREIAVSPRYAAFNPITISLLTLPNEKHVNQTEFYERDFPTKRASFAHVPDSSKQQYNLKLSIQL